MSQDGNLKRGERRWRTELVYQNRIREARDRHYWGTIPQPRWRHRKPGDCGRSHCHICHWSKLLGFPRLYQIRHARDEREGWEDYWDGGCLFDPE